MLKLIKRRLMRIGADIGARLVIAGIMFAGIALLLGFVGVVAVISNMMK